VPGTIEDVAMIEVCKEALRRMGYPKTKPLKPRRLIETNEKHAAKSATVV